LSCNRHMEDDFNKSIEYEALLTASLQLIKKIKIITGYILYLF